MELREFFSEDAVKLDLEGTTKDDVLKVKAMLVRTAPSLLTSADSYLGLNTHAY